MTLGIGAKIVLTGQLQTMSQDIRSLPTVNYVMSVRERMRGENVKSKSPNKWVHLTANPLRFLAASDPSRWGT